MTETKPILREFVSWLETAYGQPERATAAEFGIEPPPESLAMAEVALEAAIGSQGPVLLATSGSIQSLPRGPCPTSRWRQRGAGVPGQPQRRAV
jgi:hypothetical protein